MSAVTLHTSPAHRGLERAACLLKTLGAGAGDVWSHLSPDEAAMLTAAMRDVPDTDDFAADSAARAFISAAGSASPAPTARKTSIWDKLASLSQDQLAQLITRQHPQVSAVILTDIDPDAAARILRTLPGPQAMDILKRLLNLGTIGTGTRATLETALSSVLSTRETRGERDGHERVARIFDRLDSRSEQVFLAGIEHAAPGSGEHIRALMFTFDDLAGLTAAGMQTLLAGCDRGALALALKGAKPATADAFYANMTARAADFLREEIAVTGAVRRSEVEAARAEIVTAARAMIQRGEINLNDTPDDELVE